MENLHKRHSRDVVAFIKTSLYSEDVKAAIYTAFLFNYGYDRVTERWVNALEYDIVDEGLFLGGKYKDEQNKTLDDLCSSFFDRWIGGEPSDAYKEIFYKTYGFSKLQF